MDAPHGVDVEEAQQRVLAASAPLPAEAVALEQAFGRVLARDVQAHIDVPDFNSAAMDGFAVRAADTRGATADRSVCLQVVGESRAGHPAAQTLGEGEAIAIATGAQLPAGADAVVRFERTVSAASSAVEVRAQVDPGADLRGPGSDIAAGTTLLHRGERLGAAGVGAAAALGLAAVQCHRLPSVSVIATGDELVPGGQALGPGLLHDSNSHVLASLTRAAGARLIRRETVGDVAAMIGARIAAAARESDVLVLSGGVSRGIHDHVRPSLEALGARCLFWRMNVRPGAPVWCGALDGTLVFALPGSPVAAITTYALLVAPALAALQGVPAGAPLNARLEGGHVKRGEQAHAIPCALRVEADGLWARPTRAAGARGLGAVLDADCVAIVPAGARQVAAGDPVRVAPLPRQPALAV